MNVWCGTGRIGKDCETKQLGDNTVTSFSLAVDVGWGDKKSTLWLRVNLWGKRGEAVAPYLVKGQQVGANGELSLREWDKPDGTKGTSLELRATDVHLLGSKPDTAKPAQSNQAKPAPSGDGWTEDEIPF